MRRKRPFAVIAFASTEQALAAEAGVEADAGFLAQGATMLERMRAEGTIKGTVPRA